MTFVVDASVALKWVLREAESPQALAVTVENLVAPPLFLTECASGLWKAWRRGELSEDEAQKRLVDLVRGGVAIHDVASEEALRLAIALDHSVYDCTYLALAMAKDAPVITADIRFAVKVEAAGWGRHLRRLGDWPSC